MASRFLLHLPRLPYRQPFGGGLRWLQTSVPLLHDPKFDIRQVTRPPSSEVLMSKLSTYCLLPHHLKPSPPPRPLLRAAATAVCERSSRTMSRAGTAGNFTPWAPPSPLSHSPMPTPASPLRWAPVISLRWCCCSRPALTSSRSERWGCTGPPASPTSGRPLRRSAGTSRCWADSASCSRACGLKSGSILSSPTRTLPGCRSTDHTAISHTSGYDIVSLSFSLSHSLSHSRTLSHTLSVSLFSLRLSLSLLCLSRAVSLSFSLSVCLAL